MRWAVAFFPCHMMQLMNLLASRFPWIGSGWRVISLAVRFRAIAVSLSFRSRYRFDGRGPSSQFWLVYRRNRQMRCRLGRPDVGDFTGRMKEHLISLMAVGTG